MQIHLLTFGSVCPGIVVQFAPEFSDELVFFHYDRGSRAQKVALGLFKDFQGVIQSDGYAVYDMCENKKGVLPIGCWAHARRKFEEALAEDKARASYSLKQIGLLYDIERQADQQQLSYDERSDLRSRLAYPIMVAFEKWLLNQYPKVLPKGSIGKAIRYTDNILRFCFQTDDDPYYNQSLGFRAGIHLW